MRGQLSSERIYCSWWYFRVKPFRVFRPISLATDIPLVVVDHSDFPDDFIALAGILNCFEFCQRTPQMRPTTALISAGTAVSAPPTIPSPGPPTAPPTAPPATPTDPCALHPLFIDSCQRGGASWSPNIYFTGSHWNVCCVCVTTLRYFLILGFKTCIIRY